MELFDQGTSFYMPAFFKIKLATALPFEDIIGSDYEHDFFHEYLHFLQDVLTTYGLINMSKVLNCIKHLFHQVKEMQSKGNYILSRPISFTGVTEINDELVDLYLKYTKTAIIQADVKVCNITVEKKMPKQDMQLPVNQYYVTFSNGVSYYLGAHALLECLCHIVEKKIYNCEKPLQVPYDLPLLVWNYCLEDISHLKDNIPVLLDVIEYSLQFYDPAEVFFSVINALKTLPASRLKIVSNPYNFLINYCNTDTDKNANDSYEGALNRVYEDIDGTLTSDIYTPYKHWITQLLDNSKRFKNSKEFLFSKLFKMDITEARNYIEYLKKSIGLPPVVNEDGEIFVKGVIGDKKDKLYLKEIEKMFFIYSQGILSAYNFLRGFNDGCDKDLREICLHINNESNYEIYDVDDKCESSPWEKYNETNVCPFTAVWKTWGLEKMHILR